jgi:hypothetical protein
MPKDYAWTERARNRIRSSLLIERLADYIAADPKDEDENKRPGAIMTPHQVSTALALIKKVLPDVAAQTVVVHDARDKHPRDMTLEELYDAWAQKASSHESPTSQTLN